MLCLKFAQNLSRSLYTVNIQCCILRPFFLENIYDKTSLQIINMFKMKENNLAMNYVLIQPE